jgi:hypothetical protein
MDQLDNVVYLQLAAADDSSPAVDCLDRVHFWSLGHDDLSLDHQYIMGALHWPRYLLPRHVCFGHPASANGGGATA